MLFTVGVKSSISSDASHTDDSVCTQVIIVPMHLQYSKQTSPGMTLLLALLWTIELGSKVHAP